MCGLKPCIPWHSLHKCQSKPCQTRQWAMLICRNIFKSQILWSSSRQSGYVSQTHRRYKHINMKVCLKEDSRSANIISNKQWAINFGVKIYCLSNIFMPIATGGSCSMHFTCIICNIKTPAIGCFKPTIFTLRGAFQPNCYYMYTLMANTHIAKDFTSDLVPIYTPG